MLRDFSNRGWPVDVTLLYGSRVSRDVIFEAIESALAAATKKRFKEEDVEIRVEIDRVSGDLVRVIGGEHSDVVLDDGSTALFDNQHGVAALVDSILVFDNQDPEHGSRVVEYRIDDETAVAELVWEHAAASGLYSGSFGDACRLPSGNTLVAFSGAGEIGEVDPGGAVLWRLTAPDEVTFGYVLYVDSLY